MKRAIYQEDDSSHPPPFFIVNCLVHLVPSMLMNTSTCRNSIQTPPLTVPCYKIFMIKIVKCNLGFLRIILNLDKVLFYFQDYCTPTHILTCNDSVPRVVLALISHSPIGHPLLLGRALIICLLLSQSHCRWLPGDTLP